MWCVIADNHTGKSGTMVSPAIYICVCVSFFESNSVVQQKESAMVSRLADSQRGAKVVLI